MLFIGVFILFQDNFRVILGLKLFVLYAGVECNYFLINKYFAIVHYVYCNNYPLPSRKCTPEFSGTPGFTWFTPLLKTGVGKFWLTFANWALGGTG